MTQQPRNHFLDLMRNWNDMIDIQRGEDGRALCRWCRTPVSGRRRTFCSDGCVHEWRLRSSSSYLRECTFERDRGICSECGADTVKQRRAVMRLPFARRMLELKALQQRGVITRKRKSWWEADHIVPVVEGGDSNLDNIRTLCIPCHREATAQLRARRSKASMKKRDAERLTDQQIEPTL